MSTLNDPHFPDDPQSHPIVNVVIPFLVWLFLLPLVGYCLYRFAASFAFYHPLEYGPFSNL